MFEKVFDGRRGCLVVGFCCAKVRRSSPPPIGFVARRSFVLLFPTSLKARHLPAVAAAGLPPAPSSQQGPQFAKIPSSARAQAPWLYFIRAERRRHRRDSEEEKRALAKGKFALLFIFDASEWQT